MGGPMNCDLARDLAAGYVLGALDPSEEQAVRDHLASCPEPHEEFAELGGVVPALAETVELVEPPASLKQRILAAAAADLATRHGAATQAAPAGPAAPAAREPDRVATFPSAEERAIRARGRTSRGAWLLRIAAVLAIVALGASNLLLLSRQDPGSVEFATAVTAVLDAARQEGSQTAILSATEAGRPRGLATVTADGSVILALRDLAPTSGTEVYEAWVILADDPTPVAIGSFQVGTGRTASVVLRGTPATAGVTLALTREPAPGATVPTEPILSVGQATGST
jgi:anti-sigma-K factor RskA/putative zinc finger protein